MKKTLPLFLLLTMLFGTKICKAQNKNKIDSLDTVLKTVKENTAKVNTLNALADECKSNDPDTAIYFANEAFTLATKLNDKKGIADSYLYSGMARTNRGNYDTSLKDINSAIILYDQMFNLKNVIDKFAILKQKANAYNTIGNIYYYESNYSDGLKNYLIALQLRLEIGDKKDIATSYNNIGNIYVQLGNFPSAMKNHFDALKMREQIKDKQGVALSYGNIGNIYMTQNNYQNALKNYFLCLKLNLEIGNKKYIATVYNNIGLIYSAQGNDSEALKYNSEALIIRKEIGDKQGIAYSFNNIGNVYKGKKDYNEALKNYSECLKIGEEIGDKSLIQFANVNIGNIFSKQGKIKQASDYLYKGLSLAKEIGSLEYIRQSYSDLYYLDSMEGNFKQSLEHYKLEVLYRDSLVNDLNKKKLVQSQMQYDFDKKEAVTKAAQDKKDILANAEIKHQTLIKNSTFGGVGIAGIFSFFLIRSFNRRRKTSFEKQVSEVEMKALRSQMNPHFIFNSLHSINNYMMDNDKKNASDYLGKFSKLMRLILENSRDQEVPLEKDLSALELYMELEAMRFENKFSYQIEVADDIDKENTLIPPLILQPFVENSILHGMQHKESGGKILIRISKEKDMINCLVEDNGVGREKAMAMKEKTSTHEGESLGMKITNARIDIINKIKKANASISLTDLAEGMRVEVKLPLELAF